jgi:two-component system, NarL family, nitrate/nitrite response regulator NarL
MQIALQSSHKVFVVARPLVGWCLHRLVESAFPRYEAVGTSPKLDQALSAVERGAAHLVIVAEGVATAGELGEFCLRARVLLVSNAPGACGHSGYVGRGARAVVPATAPPETFFAALDRVSNAQSCMDDAPPPRALALQRDTGGGRRRVDALTARERAVIAVIAGDTRAQGKQLAPKLGISEHTLRNHLTSVYSKLCVTNRAALYLYAVKHGLVEAAQSDGPPALASAAGAAAQPSHRHPQARSI